jgi:hypothetical protein
MTGHRSPYRQMDEEYKIGAGATRVYPSQTGVGDGSGHITPVRSSSAPWGANSAGSESGIWEKISSRDGQV